MLIKLVGKMFVKFYNMFYTISSTNLLCVSPRAPSILYIELSRQNVSLGVIFFRNHTILLALQILGFTNEERIWLY